MNTINNIVNTINNTGPSHLSAGQVTPQSLSENTENKIVKYVQKKIEKLVVGFGREPLQTYSIFTVCLGVGLFAFPSPLAMAIFAVYLAVSIPVVEGLAMANAWEEQRAETPPFVDFLSAGPPT